MNRTVVLAAASIAVIVLAGAVAFLMVSRPPAPKSDSVKPTSAPQNVAPASAPSSAPAAKNDVPNVLKQAIQAKPSNQAQLLEQILKQAQSGSPRPANAGNEQEGAKKLLELLQQSARKNVAANSQAGGTPGPVTLAARMGVRTKGQGEAAGAPEEVTGVFLEFSGDNSGVVPPALRDTNPPAGVDILGIVRNKYGKFHFDLSISADGSVSSVRNGAEMAPTSEGAAFVEPMRAAMLAWTFRPARAGLEVRALEVTVRMP